MRTTLAIGFYCRSSKANRLGESPVEMSVCLSGRRVFLNLPRKYDAKIEDEAVVDEVLK